MNEYLPEQTLDTDASELGGHSDRSATLRRAARVVLAAAIVASSYVSAFIFYDPGPSWGEEGFETQDGPEGSPVSSVLVIVGALGAVAVWPRGGNSEQEENTNTSSGKHTV